MRKQYHFWPGEHGMDAWDVVRLIQLTRGLPVVQVALDSIHEVDTPYWFEPGSVPTVRAIAEHMRLTQDVDPAYPVILGPDGRVMDGMHRVARALLAGHSTIAAVRLEVLPEPDYRSCNPNDLPY